MDKIYSGKFVEFPNGVYEWIKDPCRDVVLVLNGEGFWIKSYLPWMTPFRDCDYAMNWHPEWRQISDLTNL